MLATRTISRTATMLRSPELRSRIRALSPRERKHDIAFFALAATAAFVTMALEPASGSTFAVVQTAAAQKSDRLGMSEAERACAGQSWGNESEECLLVVFRQSGRGDVPLVRMITLGSPAATAPNIFE